MMDDNNFDDGFDERARAAGRALREPAPAGGLAGIQAAKRRRQTMYAGVGVFALVGAGVIAFAATRESGETLTSADTTVVESTVDPSQTTLAIPVPAETTVAPGNVETTVAPIATPDTTLAPAATDPPTTTVPPTTTAPAPDLPPSLWLGSELVGYYADGVFTGIRVRADVPATFIDTDVAVTDAAGARLTLDTTTCELGSIGTRSERSPFLVMFSADAPIATAPLGEERDAPPELIDDLNASGVDPALATLLFVSASDNDPDLWFINYSAYDDGYPTYLATWNPTSRSFVSIDGFPDPDIEPLSRSNGDPFRYDVDQNGRWEFAYSVGDGIVLLELATGDPVVAANAIPC